MTEIIFNRPDGEQDYLECEIIGNVIRPIACEIADTVAGGWSQTSTSETLARLAKLATDNFERLEWNDSRSAAFLEVADCED